MAEKATLGEVLADPHRALSHHLAHRRAAGDSAAGANDSHGGLWTLDEIFREVPDLSADTYDYPLPTVTYPMAGRRRFGLIVAESADDYRYRFARFAPLVAAILPIDNVVAAGGAASWGAVQISKTSPDMSPPSDVDLFIHGIDPDDTVALSAKVHEIVRKVGAELAGASDGPGENSHVRVRLTRGVLTIYRSDMLKVQIILRAYPSVSAILHAFDIPACTVAFDGYTTYTTSLGAYALVHRVVLVVPQFRSTTFEYRLVKYFKRGFDLAFFHFTPGIRPEPDNNVYSLPYMTFRMKPAGDHPHHFELYGFDWEGAVHVAITGSITTSDYENMDRTCYEFDTTAGLVHNVLKDVPWVPVDVVGELADDGKMVDRGDGRVPLLPGTVAELLGVGPERAADNIAKDVVEFMLSRARIDRLNQVNLKQLARVLPAEQVGAFCAELCLLSGRANADKRRELAVKYAAKIAGAVVGKMDTPLEYWHRQDPGRQDFTAAFNPLMCDPKEWYGQHYCDKPTSGSAPVRSSRIFDEKFCVLCQDDMPSDSRNRVVLPCGHVMHAFSTQDCIGAFVVSQGDPKCAVCSTPFNVSSGDTRQFILAFKVMRTA